MRLITIVTGLLVATLVSERAEARSFRVDQVPNGSQFGCAMCHTNAQGGGPRTGFGAQVENTLGEPKLTADVNWSAIFDQDGDADGYSNGLELGDPDGTWSIGDPDPDDGPVYGPHDRMDSPCGDGVVLNPPEECDGEELNGMTCEDLGYGPGELTCNSACRFNESQCEGWEPPNGAPGNNQTNNATTADTTGETNGTNTGTTGATNGDTNNGFADDEEPTGCCATVSGKSPPTTPGAVLALLVATFLMHRVRRR